MSLFALIGLTSIHPMHEFLSWRELLRQNLVPVVGADKIRRVQRLIHLELTGVVLILLCAALMARGVGYTG